MPGRVGAQVAQVTPAAYRKRLERARRVAPTARGRVFVGLAPALSLRDREVEARSHPLFCKGRYPTRDSRSVSTSRSRSIIPSTTCRSLVTGRAVIPQPVHLTQGIRDADVGSEGGAHDSREAGKLAHVPLLDQVE